jgi:bifunctional UDP-N-acetylglucosamine pyrophosphorylase/glucosamine-1-phosphate N-acetyltransferase
LKKDLPHTLRELSDTLDPDTNDVSIILAAGHGKRIKSEKSKMLHEIWGKPTVWRVCEAALRGLSSPNQIIVVGEKAFEVARALGKRKNRVFVYQKEQLGTGDAVRVAIESSELDRFHGHVYVFPGDMGLLTEETVRQFKKNFQSSGCDMLVLTGTFEGKTEENYYGRIVKSKNSGDVIEIKEYKDIHAMNQDIPYSITFNEKKEIFKREELLNICEFNTGVYAFKADPLRKYLNHITPDNVQGEIYITDLIKIFNDAGLHVQTSCVENNNYVVAFNVKSVLKRMEETFREQIYERLKDIITIDDADDFFIAEKTVHAILEMDGKYPALDIKIGKGAHIGENVRLNRGLIMNRNSQMTGNIVLGKNVTIGENVRLSTFSDQTMEIGDGARIYIGNIIKGNVRLGKNVTLESGVRITGSNEDPVLIGDNVLIKGQTYIYGSIIEKDLLIVHSILKNMYVEKVVKKDGEIQPIKYIIPSPEGLDSLSPRKTGNPHTH